MKRIIGFLILIAILSAPGWSSGLGSWDQAQPCYPELGETCDEEIGAACRNDAWITYLIAYGECNRILVDVRGICWALAGLEYQAALEACP